MLRPLTSDDSKKIEELTQEATQLALSSNEEDQSKMQNLSQITRDLRNNLDAKLEEIANKYSSSYPYFDTEKLDRSQMDYIFYYPSADKEYDHRAD